MPSILVALVLMNGATLAQVPPPPPDGGDTLQANTPGEPAAPGDKKDDAKWDVANPPTDGSLGGWGWHDINLDTTTGTWTTLDVSPDGQTIVFDLLGDLYTMPIGGSEDGSQVTCIASGRQWDMQPRFSPDGKWIAFVSDRTGDNGKGGDNIWIMHPDGSGVRQITKETFRLVTQPVWTPDSQYIVARKHFTSRRSLGAGEMWLYHISGKTDGLQLTAKTSDQKDTGEPAVSADGRYLYYSLDASGGDSFRYDKDSNPGIYAIDRLDMKTQQTERLIAGPGGACRPCPAADGKRIAYVRRVRGQSELFVMDIASGVSRLVYDKLDRDNQETWAVHGVYPAMAWMPDGKSLMFWSGGKIRRVDVPEAIVPASDDSPLPASSVIPFRVRGTRSIANAIRFPVEVAPSTFPVKMLRNTTVSPQGDKVVFTALGHLWVAPFAAGSVGTPARLTSDETNFEYYPSWSRDGQQIAYVTWNDDAMGTVRVVSSQGGEGRVITTEPGHYLNPAISPDANTVVYEKTGGGYVTTPIWGRELGVYAIATSGGQPRLISKRGEHAQFGAESDRVYLTVSEPEKDSDKVSLISVPLTGETPNNREETLYRSDWATELSLSPDGKYLAFAERFNVCVAPFMRTGKAIDIGPKSTNVPVAKLTSEAGSYLHWSGDGTTLRWAIGPTVYSLPVQEAIAAGGFDAEQPKPSDADQAEKDGASGTKDDTTIADKKKDAPKPPPAQTAEITLQATYDAPTLSDGSPSVIVLTNAKILTMENLPGGPGTNPNATRGMKVIDHGTVIVRGNRIESVGDAASVQIPDGATVVDLEGSVISPGLIDVHAHGAQGENGFTPQRNWIDHANLAFGVTTIHDPSNDTEMVFSASEMAKTGQILAPRIFSTGTILYGAQGSFKAEIDTLDDALFHLKRMKAVGAFSVKSYNQPRRDQRQMVLEAARRLNMMVVPEGGALYQANMTMVVDGHTSVEHTLPVGEIYDDTTQLWGHSQVGNTPTLIVAYGGMGGENYWYAKTKVWANEHLGHFVPRFILDPRSRRPVDAPDDEWNHIAEARVTKKILDAKAAGVGAELAAAQTGTDAPTGNQTWGGPTLGAHGQQAGMGAHWEMWMMVQGGMSPMEALRAATIDGAWYVGLDKDIGSIAPGKLADMVVYREDPSADIRKSESVRLVMLNGRLYDSKDLAQIAPTKTPAPKYFFEDLQRFGSTPLALEAIMRQAAKDGAFCKGCGRGAE
ncbi:MAG: amidohydrolase family protein [Phycisphaerales bacterium]|jgi:imidazolonepropionase-like amidohydrolase/Tol biopolymer transport system component